jgi:hypothetical protein
VVYDGTNFYACNGTKSQIYRSADALTWTLLPLSYQAGKSLGGGFLCLVGTAVMFVQTSASVDFATASSTSVATRSLASNVQGSSMVKPPVQGSVLTVIPVNAAAGVGSLLTQVGNQVLNDTNLKTYNATVSSQTDFYMRVA